MDRSGERGVHATSLASPLISPIHVRYFPVGSPKGNLVQRKATYSGVNPKLRGEETLWILKYSDDHWNYNEKV